MMNFEAIDWNHIEDPVDLDVWDRLKSNFWVPEKIALSNDLKSWDNLPRSEKERLKKVFVGLTLLDTLQCEQGAPAMQARAKNKHEAAVFANISFMEAIHAQSYSSIFSTFCSSQEIIDLFEWAKNDEHLQAKARAVARFYCDDHPEQMLDAMQKAASVLLESFLFYSGFYLPLKYSSESILTNTADIIRLIMRDEGVHGFYIGYKYQQIRSGFNDVMQGALDSRVRVLANDLFNIEMSYTDRLYEGTSMISNVKRYLRYNYNKALDNLGYRSHGWKKDDATPESAILSQMAIDANETHDFFSGSGSSYVVGKVEETGDDDWS